MRFAHQKQNLVTRTRETGYSPEAKILHLAVASRASAALRCKCEPAHLQSKCPVRSWSFPHHRKKPRLSTRTREAGYSPKAKILSFAAYERARRVCTEYANQRTCFASALSEVGASPTTEKSLVFRRGSVVGEAGFGPAKSVTTDLQSAPFGRSGIPPYFNTGAGERSRTINLLITNQLLCH